MSQRRFNDSVHHFIDRVPVWDNGTARWLPALYPRMRGALSGVTGRSGRRLAPASRIPARTDVLDWLFRVDSEVSSWAPGRGTVGALRSLSEKSFRPQDCDRLDDWSDRLGDWAKSAQELLGDKSPSIALRAHCPACNQRYVLRRLSGEMVRTSALRVDEDGCRCGSCDAFWPYEKLPWLAQLIGENGGAA